MTEQQREKTFALLVLHLDTGQNVKIDLLNQCRPWSVGGKRFKLNYSCRCYTKVLDQDQLRPTKDQLGDQLKTN